MHRDHVRESDMADASESASRWCVHVLRRDSAQVVARLPEAVLAPGAPDPADGLDELYAPGFGLDASIRRCRVQAKAHRTFQAFLAKRGTLVPSSPPIRATWNAPE
jgi:hypothetical protein